MKENTKRLLIWLYPIGSRTRWVEYSYLEWLLPALSPAGLRSLLFLLEKKELIISDRINGDEMISITSFGLKSLTDHFPVFLTERINWTGDWSLITFLAHPKTDRNFRYLRRLLLDKKSFNLSRGVFLYPGNLPGSISDLLYKMYRSSVVVIKFREWQFGDDRKVMGQKVGMRDSIDGYSSISSEISRLIEQKKENEVLNHQQKSDILSVFDRLYRQLNDDFGLIHYYFPQVVGGIKLLDELKTIF